MSGVSYKPYHFQDTKRWVREIQPECNGKGPVNLICSIEPAVVEAAGGYTFRMTCRCGPGLTLGPGTHITFEIPTTWETHLGNTFRKGVRTVGNRKQIRFGYGALSTVECSNSTVTAELAASYGDFWDLVDIVIQDGTLREKDELIVTLGDVEGNMVQVQKHAQEVTIPVCVDVSGEKEYRRAAQPPTLRVIGAYPTLIRLHAPAVVRSGEPFPVKLLPVDQYSYNPAPAYRGNVELQLRATSNDSDEKTMGRTADREAVLIDASVQPYGRHIEEVIRRPGYYHFSGFDTQHGIGGRSNPIACDFFPDGRNIYFGELHSQMWESMGTGTTEEFFTWGRDIAGLDFCAPANHYRWRYEISDEMWRNLVQTCNRFNRDGSFVTLIGYESQWEEGTGDKNVYYRGDWGDFHKGWQQRDPTELWELLPPGQALTVPHHTKFGNMTDWSFQNDAFQRLAEICSNWGISETGGERSIQTALAMGHRLGFVGGTDSHYGLANQGSYHVNDGNGLTAVIADELTRESVFDALYNRRCYATTGDKIILDFELNDHPMGSELVADTALKIERTIAARIVGTAPIALVEIISNNETVYSFEPDRLWCEPTWTDNRNLEELMTRSRFDPGMKFLFYYIRVTQNNRQQAWSSPIRIIKLV